MKTIKDLQDAKIKDFHYIGERLKTVREELHETYDGKDKRKNPFAIMRLAASLDVKYYTLVNVERGTISATTMKMIVYYYNLGYNPMWILMPDNEFIPKQNIGENLVYQSDVQDSFKSMEATIFGAMMEFKSKI